jgi:uncharacterized protein with von Willebrand factor type A (vWA) domain
MQRRIFGERVLALADRAPDARLVGLSIAGYLRAHDPDAEVGPRSELDAVRMATRLALVLDAVGVRPDVARVASFVDAVEYLGPRAPEDLYWAGRLTLCSSPDDISRYDNVFGAAWPGGEALVVPPALEEQREEVSLAFDTADDDDDDADERAEEEVAAIRYSRVEVLRRRDFATLDDAELERVRHELRNLRIIGSLRRSRRRVPATRGDLDLRRTLRAAMRRHGEVIELRRHTTTTKARRIVLLCDVSGSMEPYARAFLAFMHRATRSSMRTEAFCVGTRLTRVTKELRAGDTAGAIAAATRNVRDWSGGTRLGETLREFVSTWGRRGFARGADVVIVSDGWDRGDPRVLAAQLDALTRLANRVFWANPLKQLPGYEPLACGMAAALPYLDEFLEGHSVESLEELAAALRQ